MNCKWHKDYEGRFGLLKCNSTKDKNQTGNWFDRTILNCGAIQFPDTTEEEFSVTKSRHINIFESIIQANIRKEAENIPQVACEFWTIR